MKIFVISFAMLFPADGRLVSDVYAWHGKTLSFDSRAKCEATLEQLGNAKKGQGNKVEFKWENDELSFNRIGGDYLENVRSYYECSELNLD